MTRHPRKPREAPTIRHLKQEVPSTINAAECCSKKDSTNIEIYPDT
jgi:hypothetical protein